MTYTHSTASRALAGAVAGMIGGAAMAMVAMIRAWALGLGFWLPVKLIAATFWGVDAIIGGAAVILAGVITHMVVSGGGGMIVGLLVGDRAGALGAMAAGLGVGIVMWAVATWLVLPMVNQVMLERQMLSPGWWFGLHLVYGAMFVLLPPLVRAFGRRERRPAAAGAAA